MDINDEWEMFLQNPDCSFEDNINSDELEKNMDDILPDRSICDELHISTNTKVLYLNQPIDIYKIFWKLPIIHYMDKNNGILKKQIKIVSNTPEEYEEYKRKLLNERYYNEVIIKQINNPEARRIKFKDERKLTIGISKKDIITTKVKNKNAFYNCFAITLRFFKNEYKEMHVKVFNTGKLEIPGIVESDLLDHVKYEIINRLQIYIDKPLAFINQDVEHNVLINSNFNCGFYINRDILFNILKSPKYGLDVSFDPCSYPGVKCKYYYNIEKSDEEQDGRISNYDNNMTTNDIMLSKKYSEISFMLFRTGSCLIVGNCNELILRFVYNFIVNMLFTEYNSLRIKNKEKFIKKEITKVRKKKINVDYNYFIETIKSK